MAKPATTAPAKKPAKAAQLDPKKTPKAQPKAAVSRKTTASAVEKIDKPSAPKKPDRRGTPKGKATSAGLNGRGRIGNPPHEPTRENRRIVETHAAVGTPHWLIAEELNLSEDTLERHYRSELDRGLLKINARIGGRLAKAALDGCKTRQIFWMKTRAGWKDTSRLEHSGPNGAPIPHSAPIEADFSKLSREEKRTLEQLLSKAAEAAGGDGSD